MDAKTFLENYKVERRDSQCVKWNNLNTFEDQDLIPVCIADADFKVSEKIQEALMKKVEFGVFGYNIVPKSYIEALQAWEKENYHYEIDSSWLRFSHGVVNILSYVISSFTSVGDEILILSPVYPPFSNSVGSLDRKVVSCELKRVDDTYKIDFSLLEETLKNHNIRLFIHCNPHNPIGRVWTKEEQEKIVSLMKKYNVLVLSDEIHQDLCLTSTHFPTVLALDKSYSHRILTATSNSKTFNLAGCSVAQIMIEDEELRNQYDKVVKAINHGAVDICGYTASEAGYRYGKHWLSGLLEVIKENYAILKEGLKDTNIGVTKLEGTYLAWLDLNEYFTYDELKDVIINQAHIHPNFGSVFGESGNGFIRINLATYPENIEEVVCRIKKVL